MIKAVKEKKQLFFSILSIACAILLMSACNTGTKTDKSANDKVVDPILLLSENETLLQVLDSVSYVPLLEDESYLFSSISKLIVRNNTIYVFDLLGSNSLLCFDLSGNFLFKVGQRGSGPNEYSKLWDFDVDDSNIYLYDIAKKQMLLYDLQGKFVKTRNTHFRGEAFKLLKNGDVLFSLAKGEAGNELLVKTDSAFVIRKVYLKYSDKDQDDKLTNNIFQESEDVVYYNKAVNDTVYSFSRINGEMGKSYIFNFKNSAVPSELKNKYEELSSKRNHEDYIYFFDTPFVVGKTLIGSIFKGKNKATLMYNLESKKFQICEWLPNKLSYRDIFLPLFTDGKMIIGWIDSEIYESLGTKPTLSKQLIDHLNGGGRLLAIYKLAR